jgi:hypothetical protein
MGPSGAVLASGWTVLAPLAYGLRGDAAVLGQHAGILGERAISAQTAGMVRVFGGRQASAALRRETRPR